MQIGLWFCFSLKCYTFIKPWFSQAVSWVPCTAAVVKQTHCCVTLPRKRRAYQGTPTGVQRLCKAVRAVAVVTTLDTTGAMCRNDCPQETQYFRLPSRPMNVNRPFVQTPCILISSSCTSKKHSNPSREHCEAPGMQ